MRLQMSSVYAPPPRVRDAGSIDGTQIPADFELANYYTSTSPNVPFTSKLIAERVGRDSRHKIVNRRFMIEARDGELLSERTFAEELWTVLDKTFGVTPPAPADELLSRFRA
jgi:N-hydroxyarylamine O-acetyltransferase